jgi:hypothetical protein
MLSSMNVTAGRALVAAALLGCAAAALLAGRTCEHRGSGSGVDTSPTPAVVTAIRDVARLEATSYHVEKVVEASTAQSRLWGLLNAKDALLLVAAGDVVAGVDLAKVRDDDVRVDVAGRTVHLTLPAPEVLSSTLDQRATHVYSRSTDVLATRNEQLEGDARRQAEVEIGKAAVEEGILDRARESADRTLRALLRALGYERVDLKWADRA